MIERLPTRTCPRCQGVGLVVEYLDSGDPRLDFAKFMQCPACYGRREILDRRPMPPSERLARLAKPRNWGIK